MQPTLYSRADAVRGTRRYYRLNGLPHIDLSLKKTGSHSHQ